MHYTADYFNEIREASDRILFKKNKNLLINGHITDSLSRNDLLRLCTLHEMMTEEQAAGGECAQEWVYDCEGMNHLVAKYLLSQDDKYLRRAQDMVISANKQFIEDDLLSCITRFDKPDPSGPYDRAYMGATL